MARSLANVDEALYAKWLAPHQSSPSNGGNASSDGGGGGHRRALAGDDGDDAAHQPTLFGPPPTPTREPHAPWQSIFYETCYFTGST